MTTADLIFFLLLIFACSERVEKQLKELQEKTESKRVELVKTQTMLQQAVGQK